MGRNTQSAKETLPDRVEPEKIMQTSLWSIAHKAALRREHRFQNLMREFTPKHLAWCWQQLNKKASPGIDKITAREYGKDLWKNVTELLECFKRGGYRAKLVLRKYIPKAGWKKRPLGVPATEDKILQMASAKILEAIYEADFRDCSHAFRPERSAKGAAIELSRRLQFGNFNYIVEADIRSYFDSIDHEILLDMLKIRIDDKNFLNLIRKWLKAGIFEKDGKIIKPETGTPQGGVISPVLSNIYLHYVLDEWFEDVVAQHCIGNVFICRYADDFVCAFQNLYDAERFYKVLGKRLAKFGLKTADEKTKIIEFSQKNTKDGNRFDFLGFEFRWGLSRKKKPLVKLRTSKKKYKAALATIADWCRKNRHLRMTTLFREINSKLRGHYNYFGVIGNYECMSDYFYKVVRLLFKWLNRRSQRKSYTWEGFNVLQKHFRIERPRITQKKKQVQFSLFNAR